MSFVRGVVSGSGVLVALLLLLRVVLTVGEDAFLGSAWSISEESSLALSVMSGLVVVLFVLFNGAGGDGVGGVGEGVVVAVVIFLLL